MNGPVLLHDVSGRNKASALVALGLALLAAFGSGASETPTSSENSADAESRHRDAGPLLQLEVIDRATGAATPARFSLTVDGKPFYPESVGPHGLRFVSIHESKKQILVVTYARGTGIVEVELPRNARKIDIHVSKGFEYFPNSQTHQVETSPVWVRIQLKRWTNLLEKGWTATDEHLHYDRLDRTQDKDWLTMLAGDGLSHAHFMVLKGGKVPGIWARQYAYGKKGEANDGERWIRSGEEYRDSAQGHINLLGIDEVIPPISTGGLGSPAVRVNYPAFYDVFAKTRRLGGLGGVAHGGSLGRHPTAVADAVNGAVDFFEIGNAHLYALDLWYRLMNCGFNIPPTAGTDLPNFPNREHWQPFLGSMRMYVQMDGRRSFQWWKRAVKQGKVFVTSGPLLSFTANGKGPGDVVRLPATGGEVTVEAELSTPIGLRSLEIVRNGKVQSCRVAKDEENGVYRWHIRERLRITKSCWLAARGEGVPIKAIADYYPERKASWLKTDAIAHSASIRVEVGGKPVRSKTDAEFLLGLLRQQQEFYRTKGRYAEGKHRLHVLELFERAIEELNRRS